MTLLQPSIKHTGNLRNNKKGILLSGGMDSIALAYWKRPKYSFTIDYGQRPAQAEIIAASVISKSLGMDHHVIEVDCSGLGSGDLSRNDAIAISPCSEWWPYRNQLIITLAIMKAVSLEVEELMIGSVLTDGSHSDGTPEFFTLINDLVKFQEGGIKISAPSIGLTTTELINKSKIPTDLLLWAHSCHISNNPCMNCSGCQKYLFTLQELGLD